MELGGKEVGHEGAQWIGGEAASGEDGQGAEQRGTHHDVVTGHSEVFPPGTGQVGGT